MKKIKIPECIRSKSGDGYVGVVVSVLASTLLLVFIINTFAMITTKMNLDHYTKEILKTATIDGQISTNITARQNQLRTETGINPASVTWTATYFNASQRTVQFGDKIEVRVTYQTRFYGFGPFNIPITMTATHSGLSQRYWK